MNGWLVWFDSLIPENVPAPEIYHKVNLSNKVVGVEILALCNGEENGGIKSKDMRVLHYKCDGRRVSIVIAGNYQLSRTRLCTGVFIDKPNQS